MPYENGKEFLPLENNDNVNFSRILTIWLAIEVYYACSSSSEPTWVKVELPPLSPVALLQEPVAEIPAEQRNQEEEARYNTFTALDVIFITG